MKILVTGSTGFVGSHLCDLLHEQGHELYCLARSEKKFQEFNVKGIFVKGDLHPTSTLNWIEKLPKDLEAVIHTAGIVHSFNTSDFENINNLATQNLVTSLEKNFSELNFIFVSSLAAAGPEIHSLQNEEKVPTPVSEYGRSKKDAENWLINNFPKAWKGTIVRPPMVIGPRDPAVLDIFKMVKSRLFVIAGANGLKNEYSFVCVYDLIKVIEKCLHLNSNRIEIFYGSFPETILMKDLQEKINQLFNQKHNLNIKIPLKIIKPVASALNIAHKIFKINARLTPDKVNELAPAKWTCSSKKSEQMLSMNYEWNIDRTLKITFEDYKTRNWI